MPSLNDPENFAGRVNYAAQVISAGRQTSRGFNNCFENSDGDAVAAALVRRAQSNPRLADNLWRYINRQTAEEAAAALVGKHLPTEARRLRAESAARWAAMYAEQDARNATRASEEG